MFVMLVGPNDDIIESKKVIGPNLKLQREGSSPLSPMLATPLLYADEGYDIWYDK